MTDEQSTVLGGRFRLVKPLGYGGAADVYLAEQVSLGRKVALKVITRRGSMAADAEARFKREALLHSAIDHPSVVRVLDFDASGPEGAIVVLEYVEGRRLDELVGGVPLPITEALPLLLQLAEGLAAIHAHGVVHRDFKAENVMVTETALGRRARILDFGLARLFDADQVAGDGRSFVSGIGVVAGTPAYLAPEQFHGSPADPRSDVYAFGVTAYFVLSGELPFRGPDVQAYLRQHAEDRPAPLPPQVPDSLAALVMRCLEKTPSRRPADGAALVAALAPMVSSPVAVAPKPRSRKWVPFAVAVSVLAAAAPVIAVERPWERPAQARLWLRAGKPARALELAQSAKDAAVEALALHALGETQKLAALVHERCVAVMIGLSAGERARLGVGYDACR